MYQMLDLKPRNPFFSLALDEAICYCYGRSPQIPFKGAIRLWSNPVSIILGRTCEAQKNLKNEYLQDTLVSHQKKIWSHRPLLCRRASGGGTVVHGPGNLNYSIFLPLDRHPHMFGVKESYRVLLSMVEKSLLAQGIPCELLGESDLVLNESGVLKKISGNSQFRKHGILMHHGTLVIRKDLIEVVTHYLKHPPREPSYREGRGHAEFMGALPENFDIPAFHNCLSSELRQFLKSQTIRPFPQEDQKNIYRLAKELARQCYARKEWILNGKTLKKNLSLLHPSSKQEQHNPTVEHTSQTSRTFK